MVKRKAPGSRTELLRLANEKEQKLQDIPEGFRQPDFFKALSDPTRLLIVSVIFNSPVALSVSQIAEKTGKKITCVSAALQELKTANIVLCIPDGNHRLYTHHADEIRAKIEPMLRWVEERP
jgi:DNA-binding transcriptional ArsR family regulator